MTAPPPPARFFDAIAGRYDRVYALAAHESRRRMARVVEALPPAPARLLDLGVGTGRELASLLDAGHVPTGLDVSKAMLARCARRSRPVPLVCADFWTPPLPFADAAFDAALALHGTLSHPPDAGSIAGLARELARIVAPGGVWVMEVPAPAWLDRLSLLPASPEQRLRKTGPRSCTYEDLVVGASIEAHILDEPQWRAALAPLWHARIEPLGELEWFITARPARR